MDNLFDRLNASTESVRSHTDILNVYPLKFQDVSDDKRTEWVKTHSDANVDKQDGGKETIMQNTSGTKEDRPSPFVIPKKKRRTNDVLLDVKVSSRDFQHEILPAITKSYRQPHSSSRFVYNQVQTVQNTYLTDAYMEKRRELRGCGYVEKELSDSFAFLCMDIENEEETNRICREGLHVGNSTESCLGHPKMGIHLCKHADILKPVGLNFGYSGHLIVFKVMKGKIKSVVENRSGSYLEPTPNYDCHLSSTNGNDLGSLNQHNLYKSTQLYLYEYGDENVRDVPRNACPVAVVRFTYNESQKDVKSPDMTSQKFSMRSPLSVKPIPSSPQIKTENQNFVVWSGHLTVKGLYACSVEMISEAGHAKPSRIGKGINITHKMPMAQARKKYLQRVTSLDRKHEGYWNGYYINVCELHPVKPEGKSHFQKVMNYLGKHNCVAIRKLEKDVVLLLLTASELTFQLGLTKPHQYPVILYSIFLSRTSRKHGAVQTDPLVHSVLTIPPAGLLTSVSSDPRLREKTKPLHINLPPSSVPHQGVSENSVHSTAASPSHTFPSPIHAQMPPPPSPTKGMRLATRVSPLIGVGPKRWMASSPPPALVLPAFFPSQPPPPLTPPVMTPTSPIQGLRSPVHAPISPINHWTLIPPPPPPPHRIPTPGITPNSPHFSQSVDIVQSLYSPVTSPVTSPMNRSASPSQSLQYCLPQTRPVHTSSVYKGAVGQPSSPRDPRDPRDSARDPRDRDPRHTRPRSPREHAWDPQVGSGYISPVLQSVNRDPVLDGGKSPVSSGPLTSSPQHPTQPPPKLQTPPPPSPRHESEGTRFESPRHFSSYPPKTSLLLSDQIKSEFTKQAKLLESIAHRNWTKSRTSTNQSNSLFSMSSDSESEMSDSEMNRIVKRLCVPTDESMDTENSAKGSPTKPLQEKSCIEEVTDMKELLNKSLERRALKKTGKIKDSQKQEAEAMRQLLNSVSCDKNRQQKGKVAGSKQNQSSLSVKPLPHKKNHEKKVSKTCRDKTISSKLEKLDIKKPTERSHSQSESTRQLVCKEKERNNHSKSELTRQSGCKEQEHKAILSKKPTPGNKSDYNLANSSQKHISKSKTFDKKCAKPHEEVCSSKAASYEKISAKKEEQKSSKSRSRTSSTSSQSSHGLTDSKKSVGTSSAPKPSKKTEQADTKLDRLKTFAEKYEESCSKKLQQKMDQKTLPNPKTSTSVKSSPVIAMKMDISLPVMASKSQTKTLPPELPSKVNKSSSSKVRARAYSSSEIENSVKVRDGQVNSTPKKAKLDSAISSEKKSSLWCNVNVNSDTSKKPVPKIGEKQQTNEKKLSFKIKGPKSLLQKDPLSVNKGSKRGLKCGKSSLSSPSSSSSAKRTNAVKEKRKIKSGVGTNREKCSIEDVLPGLYSSDKSKLGRIPKLPKIPKRGQTSSKTDTASTSTDTPQAASNLITVKPSADIPPPPGTPESNHDAKTMLVIAPLSSNEEKTSRNGAVHPSAKHVNDADKDVRTLAGSMTKKSKPPKTAKHAKSRTSIEICSEDNTSSNLISQETESKDKNKSAGKVEAYGSGLKHKQSLLEEPKDTSSNRPTMEQCVMLQPVPELCFHDQSSQKTSYSSSCCSSRSPSVERDSNTAPEKRRKHLRKRDKVESPLDSIMKSIRNSAAAKLRSSPQSWTDKNRSKSPGFSSDTERSNDSVKSFAGSKEMTNEDIEKRLQKKYDRDHSKSVNIERSTEVPKFDDLPLVNLGSMIPGNSNRICNVYSKKDTAESLQIKRQSAKRERSSSAERVSPGLDDLPLMNKDNGSGHSKILRLEETRESAVKDSRTQSSVQERSVTPEIVIPGLGDLPLSEVDQDCRSSNVVYDPLKLKETAEFSDKKTPQSAKRERSITPEIVIPGLGDLPLKDLYDNSQTSKIVYDPLKLTNTAGYAREEATQPAERERSVTPEIVIPGLGDLPFPDQNSHNMNETGPMNTAGLEPFKMETAAQENPKLNTINVESQISEERKIHSAKDRFSVKPQENTYSISSSAKDCKPTTPRSEVTVKDVDSDDGELVVNSPRVVERAGWELKLRITIPNDLREDARDNLATLDQTIRQSLHGHRQFSRLTPSETVLMTTINRVVHKKSLESPDQRQVEELNGQKKDSTMSKKSSNSPSIAELTRNLSPSLVEFARKHLSPSVTDFTRKHDPDIDLEPSDHISDFVSYESWGSNRNTDNLTSSTKAEKMCSEKNNHSASSTEKLAVSESKPASPSTSSLPASMKYVPASAFVPKKGSLAGKTFMDKTRAVRADTLSPNLGADIVPPPSTTASSGYSSDLSDSSITIRTITCAPKKDSSSTFESDTSDKTLMKSKTNFTTSEKSSSESYNSGSNEASYSTRVERLLTDISSRSENRKNEKCVKEKSSAKITNVSSMSATTAPETVSSSLTSTNLKLSETTSSSFFSTKTSELASSLLLSTNCKTSETASSPLPSTKTSETTSSPLPSTKTSETTSSSLLSTKATDTASSSVSCARSTGIESSSVLPNKTSENTNKAAETASERSTLFSPIRLPDGNKVETVSKTLVPESDKNSQVGAMRPDNQTSRKERKAQSHPYTRRRRRDSWSFDIPYRNLQDLMRDLTTATFREKNEKVLKSQKSRGRAPCRFRNYKFRRSSVPDCLPDSPDDSDEFTAEAIPDFEERKRKADIIETMQTSKKEDEEDYTAEQSSYSPGATQASKIKCGGDKEKEVEGEKENIHTRLLRISKMISPAQMKEKSPENKDTASKGSDKDTSQEVNKDTGWSEKGIGSSNTNRKRRISQTCSPSRRKDWRQSRIRHNTGLGETWHSEQVQEETSSQCRSKENTPSDVKSGKSSQRSSKESTPSDSTTGTALRRQGSREYSPSEFFCGTGEGKSSRENTPTDCSETLKRKIRLKRLGSTSEKESSLSPVTVRSNDCSDPNMFRPITAHKCTDSMEKEGGDLRDYIQQLKGKKDKKSEPYNMKVNALVESDCLEKLASDQDKGDNNGPTATPPESNRAGSPNKGITGADCGQEKSDENAVNGDSENTDRDPTDFVVKDGDISDGDVSGWIVMDEFHCQEVSLLKEPVDYDNKPDAPDNKPDALDNKPDALDNKSHDLDNKPDGRDQPVENVAVEPVTNSVKDGSDDGERKDLTQVQPHSLTAGTEVTKSLNDYQGQLVTNMPWESVTNITTEDTNDMKKQVSRYQTKLPSELSTTGTEGKDLPTENGKNINGDGSDSLCAHQAHTELNDEIRLETNQGDKNIIDSCDMSISEIGNDHQGVDTSAFVPVIHLSGTKGRKIQWAKELNPSELTEEEVGEETKGRKIQWAKELNPSELTEEEVGEEKTGYLSGIKVENPALNNIDKCQLANTEVSRDNTNTCMSGRKGGIPLPTKVHVKEEHNTNSNSSQSTVVLRIKQEDSPILNQTSESSTRELVNQISEGERVDSQISVKEEILQNVKSTSEEMWKLSSKSYEGRIASENSKPEILQGTYKDTKYSTSGHKAPDEEIALEAELDTGGTIINTRNMHMENLNDEHLDVLEDKMTEYDDVVVSSNSIDQPAIADDRIYSKSLYGYEEENPAKTCVSSKRLDCSWDFTDKLDKGSSEPIYGEYFTAATRQAPENSTDDDSNNETVRFSTVDKDLTDIVQAKHRSNSSSSSGSCDSSANEEKPAINSVNLDYRENLEDVKHDHTAITNPAELSYHRCKRNMSCQSDTCQDKVEVGVEQIVPCFGADGKTVPCFGAEGKTVPCFDAEVETIPCIGAEEETGTCADAEEELLLATNTCAFLCQGDVFTSVTGKDETSSSGQDNSQGSSSKCNLSFEAEYRENSDNELLEIGEYCADLNYRLDRDMDLGHDIEVESIISRLEEGKDDHETSISFEHFEKIKETSMHNASLEKHHWKALQSKLKADGEENFHKQKDSCADVATNKLKLQELNSGEITKKTTSNYYECFDNDDMALNSDYTGFDGTSLKSQRNSPEKILPSSINQNIEINNDTKSRLQEKLTGYSPEDPGHENEGFVPIGGREEFIPDSQEESDGNEAEMVNISNFLKSDDLRDCNNPGLVDSQSGQSDSMVLESKITGETPHAQPQVKTSTPRVSPVADFFGLQGQTRVLPSADRHYTDYVYGMYKDKPESSSELPLDSNVEETCAPESDCNILAKLPKFIQNSPLNLSVSSKPRTSEGIPGMNSYASLDCSDLADEEFSSRCGSSINTVTPTQTAAINTDPSCRLELSPPMEVSLMESCPSENTPAILLTRKCEEQNEMSTYISNLSEQTSSSFESEASVSQPQPVSAAMTSNIPEQTSLSSESGAPVSKPQSVSASITSNLPKQTMLSTDSEASYEDETVSPMAEEGITLPQHTPSIDSDCLITSSQDSDSDSCSQESDTVVLQASSGQCSIAEEHPTVFAEQLNYTTASSDVDVPVPTMKPEYVQEPQPVLAAEIGEEDGRPCTPMSYSPPQPWVMSPPPYVPNFWPYSPPLNYTSSPYFPYRPPLLQYPLNNYRFWRPPFFHYPDSRCIPLQQHSIMSSLDPRILSWTGAMRQQLQASTTGLCPLPMFQPRLPMYSSYSYGSSDTSVRDQPHGTSDNPLNAVHPNSNLQTPTSPDQGRNLPSYSNIFMQYVVHKRPVLTSDAVVSSRLTARPQNSVSLISTSCMANPQPTGHLPVVETPSVMSSVASFTRPTTSEGTFCCANSSECTTTDCTQCMIAPENIPLPDYASDTSPQAVSETPALLPPISTFTRQPEVARKSDL